MDKKAMVNKIMLASLLEPQYHYPILQSDYTTQNCTACKIYQELELYKNAGMYDQYQALKESCTECNTHKTEKSQSQTLKANAIILYLLYHFMAVDGRGFVHKANINQIASILQCGPKTVIRNNQVLAQHGYISSSQPDSAGDFTMIIWHYAEPRSEEETLLLNQEAIKELLAQKNVKKVRDQIKDLISERRT